MCFLMIINRFKIIYSVGGIYLWSTFSPESNKALSRGSLQRKIISGNMENVFIWAVANL